MTAVPDFPDGKWHSLITLSWNKEVFRDLNPRVKQESQEIVAEPADLGLNWAQIFNRKETGGGQSSGG